MSAVVERRVSATPTIEVVEAGAAQEHRAALSRRTVGGLAALCTLTALLGAQRLWTRYWIDEALTVGIASHPLASIPGVLVKDGSPPLYYLVLAAWTRSFGTSEVSTHALSLSFAIATVLVSFWAAQRLFDRRTAWCTAFFASVMPFVVYFAGETRMYALVVLESILLCVAFVDAFVIRTRRGPWWFAGALLLLVYTHYWGFYAAAGAALAVVVLVWRSTSRRLFVRPALIGFGGAAVGFLPWLPTCIGQLRSTGAPWSHTPTVRGLVGEIAALVRDERVLVTVVLATGVGLAPIVIDAARTRRSSLSGPAQRVLGLVCIGVAPIAIGWTLAHVEPSWATRYLAVSVGPMILVVGYGLARARGIGVGALAVVALLVLQPFTRVSPGIGIPQTSKSNASLVAEGLRPELPPGSVVLVAQPESVPLFAYYLGDGYRYADPRGFVTDPSVMDWRDASAALDAVSVPGPLGSMVSSLRPGDRVLVVQSVAGSRDTDTEWIQRFTELGHQWNDFLERSTCLRPVFRSIRPPAPTGYPFQGTVFECE